MGDRRPLAELAGALSRRETTSRALVEGSLEKIRDASGQGHLAFVVCNADAPRAMGEAIDALRQRDLEPSHLAGIPVAIKDLFDVVGEDTCAGSVQVVTTLAQSDSAAVARLRRSGMIPLGRTNMTEFAYSGLGINPHHGTPLSPWQRERGRVAGGSTSGGAVAVADGMVAAALGSDTGGSCRIPAAFCGLVGFKPTAARVSQEGMVPLSPTLDSVGWIANTVACCTMLDTVFTGERHKELERPLAALRFAVPENLVMDDIDDVVQKHFASAVASLTRAGARVELRRFDSFTRIADINRHGGFTAAESFAWHRTRLANHADAYDPRVLSRIERGRALSTADYLDMVQARNALVKAYEGETGGFDAVLFPTVPVLPPLVSELQDETSYSATNLLVLRNSTTVNMVDGCAISIPLQSDAGPVGLTIAGPSHQDARILAVAATIERFLSEDRSQRGPNSIGELRRDD